MAEANATATATAPPPAAPQGLRSPSPQLEDSDKLEPLPRPQSGVSTASNGRNISSTANTTAPHDASAGPSQQQHQRPLSGASSRSQQTAYRVHHDLHGPSDAAGPSRIGTPSIERRAASDSGKSAPSPVKSKFSRRNSRNTTAPESEALNEVAAPPPLQHDTHNEAWRNAGSVGDEEPGSRPGTGKWLQKQRSRGTQRSSRSGLNELDAPMPVPSRSDASGWTRREHLEDEASSQESSRESALPPPSFSRRPPTSEADMPEPHFSKLATRLYTYAYLIFFAILGTLARLGLQWLTFYPGAPLVTSVTWANVGGSLFMGFLSEDRRLFREEWGVHSRDATYSDKRSGRGSADEEAAKKSHAKIKKTIPLYVGLATGFCGSFTSFSSFQRDVFLALSNNLPTPDDHPHPGIPAPSFTSTVHRNGGYSFMALLAVIIYTVGLSLAALFVGAHIAIALDPWMPTLPFKFTRRVLDRAMLVLGPGCWLGAVFLCIWPPDRPGGPASRGSWANEVWRGEVLFALVFAPVGCLMRYYASIKLNTILVSFPLGTFAVNIFGCAVEAMCYDIQHVPLLSAGGGLIGGGRVACQVLQGMMDGFCGCLTTVSTWVAELQGLRRRHAYVYGLVSLSVGLGIMIIIMGSVRWTVGWSDTACVTMRTSM